MSGSSVTGAETGLELRIGRPGSSDLIRDLIAGKGALSPFYAGHYSDPEAFRRKAQAVHARLLPGHRRRLAEAFMPTRDSARRKLEAVLAGDGLAVTTGQQTGLFGGPLYTIYKILSAVRLAETLEKHFGEPVLAVFWIASDDHDWAEVNHTAIVDRSDDVRHLSLSDPEDEPAHAMADRPLPDEITRVVGELDAALPDTEAARALRSMVAGAYVPGRPMAAAFRMLLHGLLESFDVALIDSAHPALRRAAGPILAHELECAADHAALLRVQTDRLIAAGYHEQVTVAADAANVFLHDETGRDRLAREGDGWLLRRSRRVFAAGEIERMLAEEPTRFSPNVFLRPVVESSLIPTVAYVGGPGEVSYFAQIGCLFEAHGVEPPIVVPRHGVTIVEPAIRRLLDRFDLDTTDITRPLHELTTDVIHGELPVTVTERIERLRDSVERDYDGLAEAAAAIDPTLRLWVLGKRNRALGDIAKTEHKITSHLKKRRGDEIRQLARLSANLRPGGAPQERVLNVLPYLARYGPALLRDIAGAMDVTLDGRFPDWHGVQCPD